MVRALKQTGKQSIIRCAMKEIAVDYRKTVNKFARTRILVMGDLMIDEYLVGRCRRISPEAPVPVVEVARREFRLGGAANVANNLRRLGASVSICAVTGQDGIGRLALEECGKCEIDSRGVFSDPSRPTTLKTRIIAHNQQIARTDIEKSVEIDDSIRKKVAGYLNANIADFDAVIISDYAKGFINKKLLDDVLPIIKKHKKITNVDPKVANFYHYRAVTCITPNRKELSDVLGYEVENEEKLASGGRAVLNDLSLSSLLVTLGESGMCLFTSDQKAYMFPACARAVYDVTGAGDTVISVFTLALAAGADYKSAAIISNIAAGEVVAKLGTSTVEPGELIDAIKSHI